MNQLRQRVMIGGADLNRITDDPTLTARECFSASRSLAEEGEVA